MKQLDQQQDIVRFWTAIADLESCSGRSWRNCSHSAGIYWQGKFTDTNFFTSYFFERQFPVPFQTKSKFVQHRASQIQSSRACPQTKIAFFRGGGLALHGCRRLPFFWQFLEMQVDRLRHLCSCSFPVAKNKSSEYYQMAFCWLPVLLSIQTLPPVTCLPGFHLKRESRLCKEVCGGSLGEKTEKTCLWTLRCEVSSLAIGLMRLTLFATRFAIRALRNWGECNAKYVATEQQVSKSVARPGLCRRATWSPHKRTPSRTLMFQAKDSNIAQTLSLPVAWTTARAP